MQLILVVEDEYGAAEVMKLMLEAEGYRVVCAANGKAALDLLAAEKPALILSDFMMPHMNGAELGLAVRSDSGLSDLPFIFISGTNEDVVRAAFRDYDRFLKKPVALDVLLASLAEFANGRKSRPSEHDVSDSLRQLLKGIEIPPAS